jgi:hypothetical protein
LHMNRTLVGLNRFSGQGRCGDMKFGDILKPQHYLVTNFIVCVLSRYNGLIVKHPFLFYAFKSNTILEQIMRFHCPHCIAQFLKFDFKTLRQNIFHGLPTSCRLNTY